MLLVDIGNSRIKAAWREDDELHDWPVVATRAPLPFAGWDPQPAERPARILVSNVAGAGIAAALEEFAWARWQLKADFVRPRRRCAGMTTRYADPGQLGVDRWLAALAAFDRARAPVCVIDAGTALTVDIVLADGTHVGGLIAPGLELMRASLTAGTAQLESSGIAEVGGFADNTQDAISLGCSDAVGGLFARVAARLHELVQGAHCRWFLTGGAAPALHRLLPVPAEIVPDLVLRGLLVWARAAA